MRLPPCRSGCSVPHHMQWRIAHFVVHYSSPCTHACVHTRGASMAPSCCVCVGGGRGRHLVGQAFPAPLSVVVVVVVGLGYVWHIHCYRAYTAARQPPPPTHARKHMHAYALRCPPPRAECNREPSSIRYPFCTHGSNLLAVFWYVGVQQVRTSTGCFLSAAMDPSGATAWVEEKIAAVTHLPVENGEVGACLKRKNNYAL